MLLLPFNICVAAELHLRDNDNVFAFRLIGEAFRLERVGTRRPDETDGVLPSCLYERTKDFLTLHAPLSEEQYNTQLEAIARALRRSVRHVTGDGNCWARAIAIQVNRSFIVYFV